VIFPILPLLESQTWSMEADVDASRAILRLEQPTNIAAKKQAGFVDLRTGNAPAAQHAVKQNGFPRPSKSCQIAPQWPRGTQGINQQTIVFERPRVHPWARNAALALNDEPLWIRARWNANHRASCLEVRIGKQVRAPRQQSGSQRRIRRCTHAGPEDEQ